MCSSKKGIIPPFAQKFAATNNLAKLQAGGNKRYLTPDGKVTHLTEEQRQQRINDAKDQIDEFCKP